MILPWGDEINSAEKLEKIVVILVQYSTRTCGHGRVKVQVQVKVKGQGLKEVKEPPAAAAREPPTVTQVLPKLLEGNENYCARN
jgi:hypothetical protein